jgi:hypothetical protein
MKMPDRIMFMKFFFVSETTFIPSETAMYDMVSMEYIKPMI